jgi:uncharacterized protein (DUF58 family)
MPEPVAPPRPPPGAAPRRAGRAYPQAQDLDPRAVLAIRDLELRSRVVVEGLRAGLHRSPYSGFSVEFTEYRAYTPGDDLRYLDWRVLARTDRYVLRKYEEETNLRCWLLLDASRSMSFGSDPAVTKSDYARTLVAALAWFLHDQRDVVGTALFDEGLRDVVPPRWRPGHLRHVLASLARPPAGRSTALGPALRQLARLTRRRSLIVLVSDFLSPADEWAPALAELGAARHDVRALQIVDPAEPALARLDRPGLWEDLESGETRFVDPAQTRADYEQRYRQHTVEVRQALDRAGVEHHLAPTDEPVDRVLLRFLRERRRRSTPTHRRRPG